MSTATLTTKGQITIPAEVRHDLKVDAGDRVEFVQIGPGRYEFVAANRSVTELKGMFGKAAKKVTLEEMNAAIARARGVGAMIGLDTNVLVRSTMHDDPQTVAEGHPIDRVPDFRAPGLHRGAFGR